MGVVPPVGNLSGGVMQIEVGEGKFRFVRVDGRYLYSPYDPFREIERTFQSLFPLERPFFVVFGSAQGHVVEYLLNHGYETRDIWVTEPHPQLETWAKEYGGWVMEGTLATRLEDALVRRCRPVLFVLEGYRRLFPEAYQAFLHQYETLLAQAIENVKVTAFFSKLWWINYVRNLSLAMHRDVYRLPETFIPYDAPLLVTASGPSLASLLEIIASWQRKGGRILACLSSWTTLASVGIIPWGVVVSDAGVGNILHAYQLPPEVIVFASVYANSALLSSLSQRIVYYDIDTEGVSPSFMLSHPSVVLDALGLARRLSIGKIYVAGLDLGYTLYGTHARGNMVTRRQELSCTRLSPPETERVGFLRRRDSKQIKDDVWTTSAFQLVKQEVEKLFPEVHILCPIQPWKNPICDTLPTPSPIERDIPFQRIDNVASSLARAKAYLETPNALVYRREDLVGIPRETVKNYLFYKLSDKEYV